MNAEVLELLRQQQAMFMSELQKLREEHRKEPEEPVSEPVENSYSRWMSIVKAARKAGLDFDERDVASLSIEERRKRKIEPRFCDHTSMEDFDSNVIRRIKKAFKDRHTYIKPLSIMYINRYYAIVTVQGKPTFCSKQVMERRDPITGEIRMEVVFVLMNQSAIESMLGCYKIPIVTSATSDEVKFKDVKASTVWLGCEERLTFRSIGMNCDSNRPITDMLNMYTPPTYSLTDPLADPELAKPWVDHLLYSIANGDYGVFEYLFSWTAHVVQRPGVKIGTALAIVGPQGIGKNAAFAPVQSILGPHAFESTNADEDVLGSFNAHLAKTVFLVMNEAIWGGDKKKSGKLKGYITDPTLMINGKGRDQYQTTNHMNIVFLSNHDRIVPAEPKERRYFVIHTSDRHAGIETDESEAYFQRLRSVPVAAIYKLLMTKDLSSFRPRKIPKTDALRQQQEAGFDAVTTFWNEALKDEREIISETFLTAKECIDLRVAHYEKVDTQSMSFGDSGFSQKLVPEVYTDEKKLEELAKKYGLIRGELHETKGGYSLAIPWSWYENEELLLSRIPKKVVYIAFTQWLQRNKGRFKATYLAAEFWKQSRKITNLFERRPVLNGKKLPAEVTLPTQQEARTVFEREMGDTGYFREDEGADAERARYQLWRAGLMDGKREKDGKESDTIPVIEPIVTHEPTKSKPPTPKLSKPVSKLTLNENGRLSIAPAAATAPKSDPDPTPAPPTPNVVVQEKRGKYTFVKSGGSFQRQDATPPEPNPPISVSSKKLPLSITVPDTKKRFRFPRTVQQQSVTVSGYEESDYDREESDDAADESDDADD